MAIFAKYAPGPHMEILLSGKSLKPEGSKFGYRFNPAAEFQDQDTVLSGGDAAKGFIWQFSGGILTEEERKPIDDWREPPNLPAIRAAEKARASAITSFEMGSGIDRPFVLQTGNLDKPWAALDACLDDLVGTWGFDPALQSALASPPLPQSNPGTWITPSDYPTDMLRKDVSGAVRIRLDVAVDGKPSGCTVQGSYSDPAFQTVSCKALMRKARFKPARDVGGQAAASYWATSVVFSIPY